MEIIYERKVNYYETDKMGVVHHANYIKYFEEARIYFIEKLGQSYKEFEERGIIMPVLSVECSYKTSADFADILLISTKLTELGGVKARFEYTAINKNTGDIVCTGSSSHGFLDKSFKPLNIKRKYGDIYNSLLKTL